MVVDIKVAREQLTIQRPFFCRTRKIKFSKIIANVKTHKEVSGSHWPQTNGWSATLVWSMLAFYGQF